MGTILLLLLGFGGVIGVLWLLRRLRHGGTRSAGGGSDFVPFSSEAGSSVSGHSPGHHHSPHHHGPDCGCDHDAADSASHGGDSSGGDGSSD